MAGVEGRVALITGASQGIGRACALVLAGAGAKVALCARNREKLEQLAEEIIKQGGEAAAFKIDVGSEDEIKTGTKAVIGHFGRIDILVNNAGVGMRKPFVDTSIEMVEQIIRTNYLGAVYCTHEALPSMIARRIGHIVNISSGAGKIGTLNMAAYCGSKFALNGWSESLYHELKPLGIKVSVICPGPVQTYFNRDFSDTEPKAPPAMIMTTGAVCREVIKAIERNKFEVVMPRSLALVCVFERLMPGLFRALAQHRFRSYVKAQAATVHRPTMTGTDSID